MENDNITNIGNIGKLWFSNMMTNDIMIDCIKLFLLSINRSWLYMGKGLKGKELGTGISQRGDKFQAILGHSNIGITTNL